MYSIRFDKVRAKICTTEKITYSSSSTSSLYIFVFYYSMSIRRIVVLSLGNPGPMNRHSAGHYILHKLAERFNINFTNSSSVYQSGTNENLTLVKSLTYMNESGKALTSFIKDQSSENDLLVILYDDFEVKLGRVKLAGLKTPESHNGLRSCLRAVSSLKLDAQYIFKLGFGIGPKPRNTSSFTMGSWVLSKFKQHELDQLEIETLPLVEDYLKFIDDENVQNSPDQTARVNKIHSRKIQRGEYPRV